MALEQMREISTNGERKEEQEDDQAVEAEVWSYVLGFTAMAVVKCALDLGIADLLDKNGGSMSFTDLSSSLQCSPPYLYRIMRFLVHRKIFHQTKTSQNTILYSKTPLSRLLLLTNGKNSLAPLLVLETSPVTLSPWLGLSKSAMTVENGGSSSSFDAVHGEDLWSYAAEHPDYNKIMSDAMACHTRILMPQIVKECPELLDGASSVVDVGGADGANLSILVQAFPWIKGINFDLAHVVSTALPSERVENVAGSMFDFVPKADVAFIKWVLHNWGDEKCIQILKRCKEAIPKDKGKLIIVEAVIEEDAKDKLQEARLMLDMHMMAHTTNGKERTLKEWNYVLTSAGFSRFTVKPIQAAIQSVIEAYP